MIESSNLTKLRIAEFLSHGKRFDHRKADEFRDIVIECGLSKKAEGSAKVKIGKTEVWVGVKMEIAEPYPDSPNKGNLMVTSELLPMSHGRYEYGPPKFEAIELGRLVDRGIRESGFIEWEKLCIKEGEKVWSIFIDIYSINDDGNLLDASFIGALAALKSARIPHYDEESGKIDYEKPHNGSLPLTDNMPLNFTIYQIKDIIFVDPTIEEEAATEGRLVLAVIPTSPIRICSMQKGDTIQISPEKFAEMLDLVERNHKKFYAHIEKLIEGAIKNVKNK